MGDSRKYVYVFSNNNKYILGSSFICVEYTYLFVIIVEIYCYFSCFTNIKLIITNTKDFYLFYILEIYLIDEHKKYNIKI